MGCARGKTPPATDDDNNNIATVQRGSSIISSYFLRVNVIQRQVSWLRGRFAVFMSSCFIVN